MDFFTAIEVSAQGLTAERARINVASSNLANAQTTQTPGGGPYRRKDVVLNAVQPSPQIVGAQAGNGLRGVSGVEVANVVEDTSPPRMEYDPGHPNANADGYVAYPNVNVIEEMVDMITASRAYEAGLSALKAAVNMAERALSIGRGI